MDEDREPHPQPPGDVVRPSDDGGQPDPRHAAEAVPAPDPPGPFGNAARRPHPEPVEDNITWLIYLAIGLVVFLALVVLSSMHSAMGH